MLKFADSNIGQLRQNGSMKWTGQPGPNGPLDGAWIAEMDFGSAPAVEQALHQAIDCGFFGYMPPKLADDLRQATAQLEADFYHWQVQPDDVFVVLDVLSVLKKQIELETAVGDQILVPTPAYMPFLVIPQSLGRRCCQIPSLWAHDRWELDLEALDRAAASPNAKLLVLCNPWNPTGRVLSKDELEQIGQIALRHNLVVFSDEIHAPLTMDGHQHLPFASLSPQLAAITVTAQAASKGWNVAGIKCAQAIITDQQVKQRWIEQVDILHDQIDAIPLGAIAALTAYTQGRQWLFEARAYLSETLHQLRALVHSRLPQIRVPQVEATYLQPWDCAELGEIDLTQISQQAGVGVNAGKILGDDFPSLLRFNAATPRTVALDMATRLLDTLEAAAR